MNHIWLDVTTILEWTRSAVGIIRVETECAACALKSNKKIRFCRFEKSSRQYHEVSRVEVLKALEQIQSGGAKQAVQTETSSIAATPTEGSKEQQLKSLLIRCVRHMPNSLREYTLHFFRLRKDGVYAVFKAFREMRYATKIFLKPKGGNKHMSASTPVKRAADHSAEINLFQQNDVYISLGLDWDQKDLEYLYAQKKSIGFKVLLFAYDTIPATLPHLCVNDVAAYFAKYFSNLSWCADRVLCISECTKKDLFKLLSKLGAPIPDMKVVRLGCEVRPERGNSLPVAIDKLIEGKFILFVSTIERRKNHEILYRAYTRLVDKGVSDIPKLVFVGMPGWGVDGLMSDLKLDSRIQPYVHILNNVSDDELYHLYKNSQFTVYPSLYEGWGLPVAESLVAGKFCLASNVASIPEVGGDLIEYLDPWNVSEWVDRLSYFFENPLAVKEKEERIRKEYQPTKWNDTASYILSEAEQLCESE
ncbi:hypothetical protein A9Q88_08635 [Gammaproteobacteria bacterium 50_400_T64]|nr:hypothetical protein A9Q88_08635 [Gammaproteobacteria bacterium 50_400_T64]